MKFRSNSGPYWTPELANRLLKVLEEKAGNLLETNNLRQATSDNRPMQMLSILAWLAYLAVEPIIAKTASDSEYLAFEQRVGEILAASKIPPDDTGESRSSWVSWDQR